MLLLCSLLLISTRAGPDLSCLYLSSLPYSQPLPFFRTRVECRGMDYSFPGIRSTLWYHVLVKRYLTALAVLVRSYFAAQILAFLATETRFPRKSVLSVGIRTLSLPPQLSFSVPVRPRKRVANPSSSMCTHRLKEMKPWSEFFARFKAPRAWHLNVLDEVSVTDEPHLQYVQIIRPLHRVWWYPPSCVSVAFYGAYAVFCPTPSEAKLYHLRPVHTPIGAKRVQNITVMR